MLEAQLDGVILGNAFKGWEFLGAGTPAPWGRSLSSLRGHEGLWYFACWVTKIRLYSVIMDLLKATPWFWRAKLMEDMWVNPVFITSEQVGR